jgi:hypothetical protein
MGQAALKSRSHRRYYLNKALPFLPSAVANRSFSFPSLPPPPSISLSLSLFPHLARLPVSRRKYRRASALAAPFGGE